MLSFAKEMISNTNELTKPNLRPVYPNPVYNTLHIDDAFKPDKIEMYTIDGRFIRAWEKHQLLGHKIDMSHYKSGIYLLKIFTPEGLVSHRVVKP